MGPYKHIDTHKCMKSDQLIVCLEARRRKWRPYYYSDLIVAKIINKLEEREREKQEKVRRASVEIINGNKIENSATY